jgi:hypothetical protein
LVPDLACRRRRCTRPGLPSGRDGSPPPPNFGTKPIPRKLFWRYKYSNQQAARDGDWKYLKILDNTFLFNVVHDPTERANLKERRSDIYERLVAEWNEWNNAMLSLDPESFTGGFSGGELADHFGVKRV